MLEISRRLSIFLLVFLTAPAAAQQVGSGTQRGEDPKPRPPQPETGRSSAIYDTPKVVDSRFVSPYDLSGLINRVTFKMPDNGNGVEIKLGDWHFEFPFFGQIIKKLVASDNGYVTLSGEAGGAHRIRKLGVTPGTPHGIIAPLWQDFDPSDAELIVAITRGQRRLILTWVGLRDKEGKGPYTLQLSLGTDGSIWMTVMAAPDGGRSSSRGIEDPTGVEGYSESYREGNIHIGRTSIYVPMPMPCLSVHRVSGSTGTSPLLVETSPGATVFLATMPTAPSTTMLGARDALELSSTAAVALPTDSSGAWCGELPSGAALGNDEWVLIAFDPATLTSRWDRLVELLGRE